VGQRHKITSHGGENGTEQAKERLAPRGIRAAHAGNRESKRGGRGELFNVAEKGGVAPRRHEKGKERGGVRPTEDIRTPACFINAGKIKKRHHARPGFLSYGRRKRKRKEKGGGEDFRLQTRFRGKREKASGITPRKENRVCRSRQGKGSKGRIDG